MKACRIGTTKVKKLEHFKIFEKLFKNFRQLEIAAETNKTPPPDFLEILRSGGVFCSEIPWWCVRICVGKIKWYSFKFSLKYFHCTDILHFMIPFQWWYNFLSYQDIYIHTKNSVQREIFVGLIIENFSSQFCKISLNNRKKFQKYSRESSWLDL